MRAVVQRVTTASVSVEGKAVGEIGNGLMVLLGVGDEDTDRDLEYLVEKIVGLRIFQDENDKMNLSLMDVKGELLVISQFTLYGDVRKGKRPSFIKSARPDIGKMYYEEFIEKTKSLGIKTEKGIFGAHMDVNLINNGPVTILLDSKKIF
ncbi:D-aminoacyl-tRNA deacylase [Paratissierella segnis]|jgi:D-tyrosyl-tRNA(Tyr) deacylase|uniref:D-aminoacyl-tRNA deacylase n=1 Tax=Paratissierella segnis TaxID=2763679 RepID=A0A926EYM4_9FIRM|nr:D-aminoacyl-tRNA deacylase [Paratissierella segnis]MBC8588684.1 D-tyrosyl-tRNA(Tyr) deacylase [Paratissierella segnis]